MSLYASLKEECHQANLALPRLGLVDLTFGNVSVFDPERAVLAIKPSGIGYAALLPDDIVIVDLEGKIVEGRLRPSSDTATHRCLYQAFAGVRSVVHTHSRHAVAFAQAGRAIPCLGTTHADYFRGEVPVTRALTREETEGAYEWETGNVIVERFQNLDPLDVPAVLVQGHGPFAWGPDGTKAAETALALEIVAELALQTFRLTSVPPAFSPALLERHFSRKHGAGAYYGQGPAA